MATCVSSGGVDAVLIADDLPELGPNLVAALTGLQVDDFSHGGGGGGCCVEGARDLHVCSGAGLG